MAAYTYCIRAEEEMMREAHAKEYEEYQTRTWKLVPFIY
jgi:protein-S-isoprenylcysteine O-methyltransferase Ste14